MSAIYGVSQSHRDYDSMSAIVEEVKSIPNIDDVLFSKEAIIKFDRVIRNLLSFSFILGLFIILIAIFFVSNTILLIIHSKKDEIKTMQLLGATDIFIKVPYIINGLILGLVGSLVSFLVLFGLYKFSIYLVYPYYEMPPVPINNLLIINLVIGPLFGLIGSSRALSALVKK